MKTLPFLRSLVGSCALFALLVLYSSGLVIERLPLKVETSPNDKREWRVLELENRMKIVLISDQSADRAAVAVSVGAGSNSDPAEFRGLAHFLEHMLFFGTEKYPGTDDFGDYISGNGGSYNASTAYDNTTFHFDIEANHLQQGLDRFAQFFIAPLLSAEHINRERNAVNSEYQSGLQDDNRRGQAVVRGVMNKRHPMANFAVGSLDTLQDRPGQSLRDALVAHYDRYYSANLMTASIFGKESLDQLEQWARESFSAVQDKHRSKPYSKEPLFEAARLPLEIHIQSLKDTRALGFSFPIPDLRARYREKPLDYLANMLGHEGEGSLLKVLRDLGWANALSAGGGLSGDDANLFDINVSLTSEGMEHIDDITALLFQFIDLIDKQGISDWRYQELATMAALDFQYQEPADLIGLVAGMAEQLHYFPARDLITSSYFYQDYNAPLIHAALAPLRPDNVIITLTAKDVPTDSIEQWYQVPYSAQAISKTRQQYWQQYPREKTLAVTQPNPFIPENLELKPFTGKKLGPYSANVADKPKLILDEAGLRLWFKQDNEFFVPRSNFFVYAQTPLLQQSLRNTLLGTFLVALVNDKLSAYAYPAYLAGADFGIANRTRGFTLALGGYSDKQTQLLETLLRTLTSADFSEERFDILKAELIRSWRNAQLQTPYVRLQSEVQALLSNPYWSNEESIAAAEAMTLAEVKAFVPEVLGSLRLEALFHGNGNEADAKAMLGVVTHYLKPAVGSQPVPFGGVVKLPPRTRIVREMTISHDDSAIAIYQQGEDSSLHSRALVELTANLLAPAFFSELRTKQQLGYVVNAASLPLLNANGLLFTIESPVMDPLELEARINKFLVEFGTELENMTPEQFEDIRGGVLNDLRQLPEQLDNLSRRYWSDILVEHTRRDSQLELAEAVLLLSQVDVLDYYKRWVMNPATSRIVARTTGRAQVNAFMAKRREAAGTVLLDGGAEIYAAFKQGKEVYSYP